MTRTVECFYPGMSFPAISVTGMSCSLNCKHCGRKYLESMIPAASPDELLDVAHALAERGAKGFLLSGGSDASGRVPLSGFLEAIAEVKSTTDLRINAHIGLASKSEILALVRSGIDSFSVDVYGADETIHEVMGLDARASDYFEVVTNLIEVGAPVVAPHVCIGVQRGELKGEFQAIERLKRVEPRELVFIALIPTKGTGYYEVAAPSEDVVASVIRKARQDLPGTKLLLGCMRSKKDRASEYNLIAAGLDGIVLPSASTLERFESEGIRIKKRAVCCSIP